VPGGRWLIGIACAFSVYLICLSLVQQSLAAAGRVPIEWFVMLGIGAGAWLIWRRTRELRRSIDDGERRRILLGETPLSP